VRRGEWQRVPRRSSLTIDLTALRAAGGEQTFPLTDSEALQRRGGGLALYVVCTPDRLAHPDGPAEPICALTVMVVNRRAATIRRFEDLSFAFQVRLTLECAEGFRPTRNLTGYDTDDADLRRHDLHYRDLAVYGQGRNCAGDFARDADGEVRRLWTEPMPTAEVEKVAQNPDLEAAEFPVAFTRRGATGAFFGHVDRVEEGVRFFGADHPGEGYLIANGQSLPPPKLIIQDELHLISGPLGTVAGLYEAAIDTLAARTLDGKRVRRKIVASTATVRRARIRSAPCSIAGRPPSSRPPASTGATAGSPSCARPRKRQSAPRRRTASYWTRPTVVAVRSARPCPRNAPKHRQKCPTPQPGSR